MSRSEIESKLKLTRIIQVSLVLSVPVLAALIELGREPGSERWTIWRWVVTGLALGCVFEAFRYRRLWVRPSQQILAGDPSNARALRQWEVGQVVVLSMAEAVAAYGLVVRAVLNGTLWQALPFYLAALLLLLVFTPRRVPAKAQ